LTTVPADIPTPLVTVIIPTYNRAQLVLRAIDSVAAQTYAPIEIVVVDDGSTDDTMSLLAERARVGKIRIVTHAANRGVTAAKNTGLDAARGDYAAILDSDDELLPDAVMVVMNEFERLGEEYGMVLGNCVDPATGQWTGEGPSASCPVTFRAVVTQQFRGEFWGIWRMSVLGARRFDETLPGGSESLVWHDMYRTTKAYYVHAVLRRYSRASPDSVTVANTQDQRLQRTRRMYEAYLRAFGNDIRRFDRAAYAQQLQLLALWHLLDGERLHGVRRLAQSLPSATLKQWILALGLMVTPRALLRPLFQARLRRKLSQTSAARRNTN
jgi:glycosyltransferase involved in cell wall biosynthesis